MYFVNPQVIPKYKEMRWRSPCHLSMFISGQARNKFRFLDFSLYITIAPTFYQLRRGYEEIKFSLRVMTLSFLNQKPYFTRYHKIQESCPLAVIKAKVDSLFLKSLSALMRN